MRYGSCLVCLLVLCPALVNAFIVPALQPALRGPQVQHATALRSDAGSASFGELPLPLLALSYVDTRDVERMQKILTEGGARNVGAQQAKFGMEVAANVAVEPVLRNLPDIAALVRPSGQISFEGIRADEAAAVKSALAKFFEDLKVAEDDSGRALVSGWRIDPWMVAGFSSLQLAEERERDRTNSAFWKWVD
jgi:hypothetical protein